MDAFARRGLELVENGSVKFVPPNWINTYRHWLENIQDWCISRQLWWGHRIPAWYDIHGNIYVARSEEEAKKKFEDFLLTYKVEHEARDGVDLKNHYRSISVELTKEHGLRRDNDVLEALLRLLHPVSYTHLDVYKRQ